MITTSVTEAPISAIELAKAVKDDGAGAVVTFSGEVRNNDANKEVISLKYEIHPSAPKVLDALSKEIASKHGVTNLAVAHRYGDLKVGDVAFAVAVSAPHRNAAFSCCQEIVERVKKELPIWKFQEFADGSNEWVNSA